MSFARDVSTARRACTGIRVGAGWVGSSVFVDVGECGLDVAVSVGVAELEMIESSVGSVGAAGAHAARINAGINSRDDQKGSRKLSSIFYLFPVCVLR